MPSRMDLIHEDDDLNKLYTSLKERASSGDDACRIAMKCEDIVFCLRGRDPRGLTFYKKSHWPECPKCCAMYIPKNAWEETVKASGFKNVQEFNSLVAAVDLSDPIKASFFKEWQKRDGSKKGLLKIMTFGEVCKACRSVTCICRHCRGKGIGTDRCRGCSFNESNNSCSGFE